MEAPAADSGAIVELRQEDLAPITLRALEAPSVGDEFTRRWPRS